MHSIAQVGELSLQGRQRERSDCGLGFACELPCSRRVAAFDPRLGPVEL